MMTMISKNLSAGFPVKLCLSLLLFIQSPHFVYADSLEVSGHDLQAQIFNEEAISQISINYAQELSEMSDNLVEALRVMETSGGHSTSIDMMLYSASDCNLLCRRYMWEAARSFGRVFKSKNRQFRRDGLSRDERAQKMAVFSQQLLALLMAHLSHKLPENLNLYLSEASVSKDFNETLLTLIRDSIEGWRSLFTFLGAAVTFVIVAGGVVVGSAVGLGFIAGYLIIHIIGAAAVSGAVAATTFTLVSARSNSSASEALDSLEINLNPTELDLVEGVLLH
jgi:hypothetical protein